MLFSKGLVKQKGNEIKMERIQYNKYAMLSLQLAKLYKELAELYKELDVILNKLLSNANTVDMDTLNVQQSKRNTLLNEIKEREKAVGEIRNSLKL